MSFSASCSTTKDPIRRRRLPPFAVEGTTEGIVPRSAAGLLAPYEPLSAGAAGFGVLSFQGGLLGQVASAPVFAVAAGETFPGFSLEAVRVAEKAPLIVLRNDPNRVAVGTIEVPFDSKAEMRLHFSSRESWADRTIPAWEILAGSGDWGPRLADKLVLIGSSAPEAGAFLPIAGAALAPTVQIQAEAIEQILTASFLKRPEFVVWWEALAMLAVGLLAVAVAVQLPPAWTVLSAFGIAVCWLAAVATAFRTYGLLIDPIGPTAVAVFAANVTEFAAFIRTRALKTAIQQRFERYVPPEVVARLVREPETLRLDGELREVTALLTDIEDFSSMTERSDPRMLVRGARRLFRSGDGADRQPRRHGRQDVRRCRALLLQHTDRPAGSHRGGGALRPRHRRLHRSSSAGAGRSLRWASAARAAASRRAWRSSATSADGDASTIPSTVRW